MIELTALGGVLDLDILITNMGILLLAFLQAAFALIVTFRGKENALGYSLSKKFSMYEAGDLFGMQKPFMNVSVLDAVGKGNYFGVMIDSLYQNLRNEDLLDLCKFNNYSFENVEQGRSIYKKIEKSGLYAVVVLVCNPSLEFSFEIQSKNPFGHLTGDHIFLIPVNLT